MEIPTRVTDLHPDDLIDIPERFTAGTDNEIIARYEYARLECLNGGWADAAAGSDEVVLYVPNWVAPVILPADAEVTLIAEGRRG